MKKSTKRTPRPRTAPRRKPAVPESAGLELRQLWLAGLGAMATTGEAAASMVEALVARGRTQEPKTRAAAAKAVREARRSVEVLANEAGRRSRMAIDEAMNRLGVDERPRSKNILHRLGDLAEAML